MLSLGWLLCVFVAVFLSCCLVRLVSLVSAGFMTSFRPILLKLLGSWVLRTFLLFVVRPLKRVVPRLVSLCLCLCFSLMLSGALGLSGFRWLYDYVSFCSGCWGAGSCAPSSCLLGQLSAVPTAASLLGLSLERHPAITITIWIF